MKVQITKQITTYYVTSRKNHIHISEHKNRADAFREWEDMPRIKCKNHGITERTVTYYRNAAGQEWRDATEKWI